MEMNTINQNEMIELAVGLRERHIAFNARTLNGGLQIICDRWDAVCNELSNGHQNGLIEVLGLTGTDVVGNLTAREILDHLDRKEARA